MTRPPRLPYAATRVIRASRVLTWPEKAVWLELYGLDAGPDGAWIAAKGLAERLGLAEETVDAYRRRLAQRGLLVKVPRPGAKTVGWVAVLPDGCAPGSQRPTEAEVRELYTRLDWRLGKPDGGAGGDRTVVRGEPVQWYGLNPDGGTGVAGGAPVVPTSDSQAEQPLPPAVTARKAEAGEAASAEQRRMERRQLTDEFEKRIANLPPERQRALRRMAYGL